MPTIEMDDIDAVAEKLRARNAAPVVAPSNGQPDLNLQADEFADISQSIRAREEEQARQRDIKASENVRSVYQPLPLGEGIPMDKDTFTFQQISNRIREEKLGKKELPIELRPPPEVKPWYQEIPTQLAAGAWYDLPKAGGHALAALGIPLGKDIVEATEYAESQAEWARPTSGNILAKGARAIPTSLAVPATIVATGGGVIPAAIGAGAGFFLSTGHETYQRVKAENLKNGVPLAEAEANALQAGIASGTIEGGVESASLFLGPGKWVLKSMGAFPRSSGIKGAIKLVEQYAKPKRVVYELLKSGAWESGTEAFQGYTEQAVENYYGGPQGSAREQALEGAKVALGMTTLLAPFGIRGVNKQNAQRNGVVKLLGDSNAPASTRSAAATMLATEMKDIDAVAAENWTANAMAAIALNKPVPMTPDAVKGQVVTVPQARPMSESERTNYQGKYESDIRKIQGTEFGTVMEGVKLADDKVLPEAARPEARLTREVARNLFKKTIYFVDGLRAKGKNAAVSTGVLPDAIFIDVNADNPLSAVMMHELGHHLEKDAPKLYSRVSQYVEQNADWQKYRAQVDPKLTDEQAKSEFIGDLFQQSSTDPAFWQDVAAKAGDTKILTKIVSVIDKWIKQIGNLVGKNYEVQQYVGKLEETKKVLSQVVAEYSAMRTGKVKPAIQPAVAPVIDPVAAAPPVQTPVIPTSVIPESITPVQGVSAQIAIPDSLIADINRELSLNKALSELGAKQITPTVVGVELIGAKAHRLLMKAMERGDKKKVEALTTIVNKANAWLSQAQARGETLSAPVSNNIQPVAPAIAPAVAPEPSVAEQPTPEETWYHGTHNIPSVFDREYGAKKNQHYARTITPLGIWFSKRPEHAKIYGPKMVKANVSVRNPLVLRDIPGGKDAHAQLESMVDAETRFPNKPPPNAPVNAYKGVTLEERLDAINRTRAKLQAQGYDGIKLENTKLDRVVQDVLVAFETSQVNISSPPAEAAPAPVPARDISTITPPVKPESARAVTVLDAVAKGLPVITPSNVQGKPFEFVRITVGNPDVTPIIAPVGDLANTGKAITESGETITKLEFGNREGKNKEFVPRPGEAQLVPPLTQDMVDKAAANPMRLSKLLRQYGMKPEKSVTSMQKQLNAKLVEQPAQFSAVRQPVTPEQDAAYLKAVQSGDTATVQKMVDEAAKKAGYNVGPVWHGTASKPFNVFDAERQGQSFGEEGGMAFWFTNQKREAQTYRRHALDLVDRERGGFVGSYYLRTENPAEMRDVVNIMGGGMRFASAIADAQKSGHDAVAMDDKYAKNYAVFDPSQIKSADPITRDDAGNVIPLSQRFNPQQDDIRFSRARGYREGEMGSTEAFTEQLAKQLGVDLKVDKYVLPNAVALERGKQMLANDPRVLSRLISEAKYQPRALTPEENSVLLVSLADRAREFRAAQQAGVAAVTSGDYAGIEQSKLRQKQLLEEATDIMRAMRETGSEAGRALQAKQMTIDENMTLLERLAEAQIANGYKPLDAKQTAAVTEIQDDFEKADAAYRESLRKSMEEYENDIMQKAFGQKKQLGRPPLTRETFELKQKRDQVVARWRRLKADYEFSHAKWTEKLKLYAGEPLNFTRAMLSAFDLSFLLRQGGFLALGHPRRAIENLKTAINAFADPHKADQIERGIRSRPNALNGAYDRMKIEFTKYDPTAEQTLKPEMFMSRFADVIPGVKQSSRAFVTAGNQMRADTADALLASLPDPAKATTEELRAIGNFVNVATGRGNMGDKAKATEFLATILWSPRLLASRFQLLAGQPLYHGSQNTRKLIAGEYARFLTGLAAVYALGAAAGAEEEKDPRSSDFGKLKFGNTRIDPLAGLSQVTVLLSRLATGQKKSEVGAITDLTGAYAKRGEDVPGLITQFLRTKLSPVLGTTINVMSGESVVGEKPFDSKSVLGVPVPNIAQDLLVPLSFRDILDVMKENGVPEGAAITTLGLLGMGVQNYSRDRDKPVTLQNMQDARRLKVQTANRPAEQVLRDIRTAQAQETNEQYAHNVAVDAAIESVKAGQAGYESINRVIQESGAIGRERQRMFQRFRDKMKEFRFEQRQAQPVSTTPYRGLLQ